MKSKWFKFKETARNLRKRGYSIGKIEHDLGIPRSTLSGWFKDIKLTRKQKITLIHNWKKGLIEARKKAILWHNNEKIKRLKQAEIEALKFLENINTEDEKIIELALAILYLGEGSKKNIETAMGSSDPLILKFFIFALRKLYDIPIEKIKCQLNLRADQDPDELKKYWAKELNLPESNFGYIALDKRTIGSKTYPNYKGVCQIRCGLSEIQRKLIYLSNRFCEKVVNTGD